MLTYLNKALKKEPLTPRLEARSFIHAIKNFEPKAKETDLMEGTRARI